MDTGKINSKSSIVKISIILPTYNRVAFLSEAIDSIISQTMQDWELIIVDDGSSDGTCDYLQARLSTLQQPYRYIYQDNRGAYAARNCGLDYAKGDYVAFYDSDDRWLPHHLKDCLDALENSPGLGWVYGASRIVDFDSKAVLSENCFYESGRPRPFLGLKSEKSGNVNILEPGRLIEKILSGVGLYAGLQNSVIRRSFFETHRFNTSFYNEAEDQVVIPRAICAGVRFGYIDDVHVEYRIHASNSSGASKSINYEKQERLVKGLIQGYEILPDQISLSSSEKKCLKKLISSLYMWHLGYCVYWENGRSGLARKCYVEAIKRYPFEFKYWKTFLASYLLSHGT